MANIDRILPLALMLMAACGFEAVKPGDSIFGNAGTASCEALGKNCGSIQDGAGGTLNCGTCAEGEVCGASGIENICCTPTSCEEQGANCGQMSDGCGGTLDCGGCALSESCGGTDTPNVCGAGVCSPTTCAAQGVDCGGISDGCGATLDCGICAVGETCGGGGVPNQCGSEGVVIPSDLQAGCFGWPDNDFSQSNFAQVQVALRTGALAVDFTLLDTAGQNHTLSELLQTKPVVIQFGSYTCPVYQNKIEQSNQLAALYGDQVHFLVVYVMEAHPAAPDPSPYRGRVWAQEFSDRGQSTSYESRRSSAAELGVSGQLMLVDALSPDAMNPVWCTYGTAPNSGFLIHQDGSIVLSQSWFDAAAMRTAIEGLLAQ